MKARKLLLPLLLILGVMSVCLAVFGPRFLKQRTNGKHHNNDIDSNFSLKNSRYTPALTLTDMPEFPPLLTDIPNIFYTVNPKNGDVSFFEYSPTGLNPYGGEVFSVEKTVTCSHQDIPVTLSYIEKDGKVAGYGLYTSDLTGTPGRIYPYALFKLTALPPGYGKQGALLLIDFDKKDFWQNDRLYTEAFIIGLKGSSLKTQRFTTNNSRTVDETGAFRSDWTLFTDYFLKSTGSTGYFLSSRDYNLDQKGLVADILSPSDLKPPRVVTGILGLWAGVTPKGLTYLRPSSTGFDLYVFADKKERLVKSFDGDYRADYLAQGDYVLNKKTLMLTNLITGEEKLLKDINISGAAFLSVSPDGSRAVIASPGGGENPGKTKQSLIFYNLEDESFKSFAEPLLFSVSNPNFGWAQGKTLFHLRPARDDGTGLAYCFIDLSALDS